MYIRDKHMNGFIFRETSGNITTTKPVAKSSDEYLPYQSKYSSSKYSTSNNNTDG